MDSARAFDLDGPFFVPQDQIHFVPARASPKGEGKIGLSVGLEGTEFHKNIVFKGLSEFHAANARFPAREVIGDTHIKKIKLFGCDKAAIA